MIVDGRAYAGEILRTAKSFLEGAPAVVRAVVVAPSPATESYLAIKAARAADAGMRLEVVRLSDSVTTDEVCAAVQAPGADAVIVQLPLPKSLDEETILNAIPLDKDADVLSSAAYKLYESGRGIAIPPVAAAVGYILGKAGLFNLSGKRAVVVGQGRLVGKPVTVMLREFDAEVSVITRDKGNLSILAKADIIVTGAGVPGLIKPEHLKPGVVLIDAGTSEQGGAIVGDADPACAGVASLFTPVPGGVGPIAVACLFRNVAELLSSPLRED